MKAKKISQKKFMLLISSVAYETGQNDTSKKWKAFY